MLLLKLRRAARGEVSDGAAVVPERHVLSVLREPHHAQDRPRDGCALHPDLEGVPFFAETAEVLLFQIGSSPIVRSEVLQAALRSFRLPDKVFREEIGVGHIVDRPRIHQQFNATPLLLRRRC